MLLGLAYQQRARETGDPTYYAKSGGALQRARSLKADDELVYSGLGSLALSRHRFREALALGRKAHELNKDDARNYGVIGDALVELGRYPEAFRAFDTMNRLRPSLSSYSRVSYGRELIGHTDAAIKAMKLAVDAATDTAEPTAWTHVQLGKLYFNHGRYARRRARVPARELRLPELRLRARRARAGRGRARELPPRDRPRAPGGRPDPAAPVRGRARRPLPRHRASRAGAAAVRADRGDRAAAAGERRQDRPRDRALRRRPRHRAPARARAGAHRAARPALDRRRRRARLGAGPERPVLRGAALLEERAPARHAGRGQVLPPRDDRALPRPLRGGEEPGSDGRSRSTRSSR